MATQVTLGSGVIDSASGLKLRTNGTTEAVDISTAQVATLAKDAVVNGLTVGRGAGAVSTNTAVGASALAANTTGNNNTAFGQTALTTNTIGNFNTAVGRQSLFANTSGTDNSGFGLNSLVSNTTGSYNTAIGRDALQANTTASNNTAVGYQALYSNATGSQNTAVGYKAFYAAVGGAGLAQFGVAIGYQAAQNLTTGNAVLVIGAGCAPTLTTGSNGLYIGAAADASSASVSQEMAIISTNGASIAGKGTNTGFIAVNTGGSFGSLYQGNNTTTWATTSDERIKKNIIDVANGLSVITALRPVEFDYKQTDKHEVGFIAQEYAQVLPEQIITHAANAAEKEWVGNEDVKGIQQNLVPYLVKAIQELKAEVDSLKAQINGALA